LDYKIKELKLQIAPRENEITIMQRQIEDMDLELEQYHKSNLALNLMIGMDPHYIYNNNIYISLSLSLSLLPLTRGA
jgi:hypothetical protein